MSNYLVHSELAWKRHKYVSRKKGPNGKWIYTYADGSKSVGQKYFNQYDEKPTWDKEVTTYQKSPDGKRKIEVTTKYVTNANRLFDSKSTSKYYFGPNGELSSVTERIEYGKLHIARKAIQAEVSALVEEFADRGKSFVKKLFKK